MTSTAEAPTSEPLPREIAPGLFWLGGCLTIPYQDTVLHGYNSVYLLAGDDCSMLIEGGHPEHLALVERQIEDLLGGGLPELRHVFVTHTETPHSAGLGRILDHYPDVEVHGDVIDLHLVFPQHRGRFHMMDPGDSLDLGGTEFVAVEAVLRDMAYTRWGFDTRGRTLFPGDGFAYSHYHEVGHCGALAEEAVGLDLPDMTALFADLALYWTRFSDMEPYISRLDAMLFDELGVELIAPTHGLPISDLRATVPIVYEGLRAGAGRTAPTVVS